MTTQRQARTARRTLAELLTFSIIVATLQVVGATEPATANDPEVGVNIHVVKVDDQDGDGSINFNTHPRLSGVAFDLYLDGATTPDSSITTTYSGIVTGVLNSDIIGTAPVGTPYVICESVPAGWTNTNPTLAPDPENNGRPCIASTISEQNGAAGGTTAYFTNQADVNIHVVKVDDQDGDGSINFNTHPRLSGVAFDLYLDGTTTPDSSITTTYSGIVTGSLNSDIIGTAPVGTPYVICESVAAGWTNTNLALSLAPDPENNGRPCIASTISEQNGALGSATAYFTNQADVNIHVVKVDDQDGDGSINFNTHPRLSGVAFDLYLDGTTTPDSSITTTYSGIVTGSLNSDIIGTAPVGTPYVICESVPAGWTNTNLALSLAPDPENNGRPCIASTISEQNGALGSATAYFTNQAVAIDLSVTKIDSVDPVDPGGTLTYTITVANAGPATATGVVATDTLPAGVTFVSSSGCAEDPNGAPTCSLGSIAPGGSAQYTITVTVDAGTSGTITNSVQVAANEGDPWEDNNSTTEDTPVTAPQPEADLSITKIDSVDPVDPGGTLTYTITVANAGPATATGVVATDTLPAGVTFVSSSGCAEDPNGAPTCSLGSIAPGGSAQYTITVTVDAGTSGTITNNASVTATQVDPNLKDNSIGEDTEVRIIEQPPGRIVIVKDTVPDNAQDFSFTVTGDLTPSSFSLDDDADGTLSNTQSFDGVAEGTYTVTETSTPGYTTTIVCNDPNSNTTTSGSTATIRVDPEEAVTCTFTNTAAPPPPPDPRIDIEKATNGADADTPTGPVLTVGDPVAWTYEITNPGDVVLANVQVVDDNGTPGIPGDDFNPTFVAGDTTANGLLDPGETWTYAASGTAIAGQYANIATVTAQAPDQVPVYDADASHYMGTTPPPPPPAVCPGGTITFGGFKLLNQDHNNTVTAAYSSPAGTYDIRLYSRDSGHAAGVHPDQTAEQWLLDITLADGSVVTLGATADLAEALTAELTLSQNGVLLGADIVSLTARHARIGSTSDSVSPCVGLTRIGDPPPPSPTCQSNAVGFGGGKLINVDGRDVSPIAAFNLPAGNYRATLFSADAGHAPGVFPEQDSERWSAVITLADGNVVTLGPTADLAEGQTFAASLAADVAFGSPVVSVYARHARLGTSHDSIVPVCVHFAPHALADSSEGLADVGDE